VRGAVAPDVLDLACGRDVLGGVAVDEEQVGAQSAPDGCSKERSTSTAMSLDQQQRINEPYT